MKPKKSELQKPLLFISVLFENAASSPRYIANNAGIRAPLESVGKKRREELSKAVNKGSISYELGLAILSDIFSEFSEEEAKGFCLRAAKGLFPDKIREDHPHLNNRPNSISALAEWLIFWKELQPPAYVREESNTEEFWFKALANQYWLEEKSFPKNRAAAYSAVSFTYSGGQKSFTGYAYDSKTGDPTYYFSSSALSVHAPQQILIYSYDIYECGKKGVGGSIGNGMGRVHLRIVDGGRIEPFTSFFVDEEGPDKFKPVQVNMRPLKDFFDTSEIKSWDDVHAEMKQWIIAK